MIKPQPLLDLSEIHELVQKYTGKKNLKVSKFKLLKIANNAKKRDEIVGLFLLSYVYIYFNEFREAEEQLKLIEMKSPNNPNLFHQFLTLYLSWGKWRDARNIILKLFENEEIDPHKFNIDGILYLILSYFETYFDLDLLEKVQDKLEFNKIKDIYELVTDKSQKIEYLNLDGDYVRDVLGMACSIFSKKFNGNIFPVFIIEDGLNILLYVISNDIDDFLELNKSLIESKLTSSYFNGFIENSSSISMAYLPIKKTSKEGL